MIVYPTISGVVTGVGAGGSTIKLNNGKKVKAATTEFRVGEQVLVAMNMGTNKVSGVYNVNCTTPFPIETEPMIIDLPLFTDQ